MARTLTKSSGNEATRGGKTQSRVTANQAAGQKKKEEQRAVKKEAQNKLVDDAFRQVFGRSAEPEAMETYQSWKDPEKLKRHLAVSREAQNKRIDAGKYGATAYDTSKLSGKDRQYYDVWAANNPGLTFYEETLDWMRDRQGAMNLKAFEAEQLGLITQQRVETEKDSGKFISVDVVDPRAVQWAGDEKLKLYGNRGWNVIAPEGVYLDDNFGKKGELGNGYFTATGLGKQKDSLLGGVGEVIAKIVPDELKLALDPLGLYGSSIIQEDWNTDAVESLGDLINVKPAHISTVQGVGRSVVQGALTATGVGAIAAVGMEFAAAANNSVANRTSLSDAFEDAAWNSAAMLAGQALGPAKGATGQSAVARTTQQALASGAVSGISSGLRYGDWGEAGKSALWSAGGSALGAGIDASLGSGATWIGDKFDFNFGAKTGALVGGLSGAAGQVASQGLRYSVDDDFASAVDRNYGDRSTFLQSTAVAGAASGTMQSLADGGGLSSFSSRFGTGKGDKFKFTRSPMLGGGKTETDESSILSTSPLLGGGTAPTKSYWPGSWGEAREQLSEAGKLFGIPYTPVTFTGKKLWDFGSWAGNAFIDASKKAVGKAAAPEVQPSKPGKANFLPASELPPGSYTGLLN
jgi:hypothetical protein